MTENTVRMSILTVAHGAHDLVHAPLLLVKEYSSPEADHQVRVLLQQRHLDQSEMSTVPANERSVSPGPVYRGR